MRIAVFLDNINFKDLDNGLKTVLLFDIDETIVTAVGRYLLHIYNLNYLATWLLGKRVEIAYIQNPDKDIQKFIDYTGIQVKPLDEIKENPLLESLQLPLE